MSGAQAAMLFGSTAASGASDPFFSNVVFLWEGDGVHGTAGPFTDVTGKTITLIGGALSNVQAPPGATCSYRVGAAGGASVPDSADFRLAAASSDPYTIEFSTLQTDLQTFTAMRQFTFPQLCWRCNLNAAGLIHYNISNDGTTDTLTVLSGAGAFTTGAWYHWCMEQNSSGLIRLYQNGTMINSTTPGSGALFDSTASMIIGDHATNQGYIARMRLTKGTARYNTNGSYTLDAATGPFPTH